MEDWRVVGSITVIKAKLHVDTYIERGAVAKKRKVVQIDLPLFFFIFGLITLTPNQILK